MNRVEELLGHAACVWFGHVDHCTWEPHRFYLRCDRCGRETPGWRDDELPKPRVIYPAPVKRKFRLLKPKARKSA